MAADNEQPAVRDVTIVLNDNDHTIDPGPARHLAAQWVERVVMTTYRFDREFLLPHDVIDVSQRCGMPEMVYPALIALLEKQPVATTTTAGRCASP